MLKIGFIGTGNMGYAIMKGLSQHESPQKMLVTDLNEERAKKVAEELESEYVKSNSECAKQSNVIVLAVKPQFYPSVLNEIKNQLQPDHILISIAPGITIERIRSIVGENPRIVRSMPNTPALVGEGMTGVCYDKSQFNDQEKETIHSIFTSFGKIKLVDEALMNAVVCVSGSSPAYAYLFVEALADSAVKYGLPRDAAYEMAAQTLLGSAKMVLETGEHPGKLKDQVCSPGGTTIAAVSALEEHGFRNAIIKATDACYKKTTDLA